jgi:hypothetical protein
VYTTLRGTFSGSTPSGARVNDWVAASGVMNLFIALSGGMFALNCRLFVKESNRLQCSDLFKLKSPANQMLPGD